MLSEDFLSLLLLSASALWDTVLCELDCRRLQAPVDLHSSTSALAQDQLS